MPLPGQFDDYRETWSPPVSPVNLLGVKSLPEKLRNFPRNIALTAAVIKKESINKSKYLLQSLKVIISAKMF